MKKLLISAGLAAAMLAGAAGGASAASDRATCSDMFGLGWETHGEHVLGYVRGEGGAAGGAPAHLGGAPAPGASFCLTQAQSPGLHFP